MLEYIAVVFCGVLLFLVVILRYLRNQTVAYVKIGTLYTNKFLNKEITFEEYSELQRDLKESIGVLLRWYLRKENILDV